MQIEHSVSCPVHHSFRVDQVAGMFDVPLEDKLEESFSVEVPDAEEDWRIGVIVGPSGSGKSTIARAAYGDALVTGFRWPKEKAVIDGFPEAHNAKQITHILTAVGFSSPPSWVKPYHVLSGGERFRCDLARALLLDKPLVAFDEFTSVVDRTVAKIGSAAVSKAIHKGHIERKFVAVTCHYDVVDWLQADWVLDMASGQLARGRLRRPEIRLEIAPVHRSAWVLFRRHHYLSGNILPTSKCFCGFVDGVPAAFSAWVNRQTRARQAGDMREHRTVVLPDFQGVGIGNRLSEFCASIFAGIGGRSFSTTSHPSMIGYRSSSPNWDRIRLGMAAHPGANTRIKTSSSGRLTGGFEFTGRPMDRARAKAFLDATPGVFVKRPSVQQVEALIKRHPGATMGLLSRLSGLSSSGVRHCLDDLIEAGDVRQEGRGGAGGRQQAFYSLATLGTAKS